MPSEATGGWIKLWRDLARQDFWLTSKFTRGQAFVDLLLRAAFRDHTAMKGNRQVIVRRGQVLTSTVALGTRWRINRKTVRAWLSAFEADGALTIETDSGMDGGHTLITIKNYEAYQSAAPHALDNGRDTSRDDGLDDGAVSALDSGLDSALDTSEEVVLEEGEKEGREGARARQTPLTARTILP